MAIQRAIQHSIAAGDIKIKLVEVELITLQISLVTCSVDKAKEMGMDWWVNNLVLDTRAYREQSMDSFNKFEERLIRLDKSLGKEKDKS